MIALASLPAHAAELVGSLAEVSLALAALIAVAALLDPLLRHSGRPHLRLVPWLLVIARPLIPLTLVAGLGGWIGLADPLLPNLSGEAGTIEPTAAPLATGDGDAARATDPARATEIAPLLLALLWFGGVVVLGSVAVSRTVRTRRALLARAIARDGDLPAAWRSAAAHTYANIV